jgi:hypothetical protein
MNPFNPETGTTPAPADPAVWAVVERSAAVIWRAFPYFSWRFDGRGRAFGRSDAGYLATLADVPAELREDQILWLANLLSCRGMPSFLLEVQLELLARVGARRAWSGATTMSQLAGRLRVRRQRAMSDECLRSCDQFFLSRAAPLPHRWSIGALIAAEVADLRLGYVQRPDVTLGWLLSHGPDDVRWRSACLETRALAEASRPRAPPG